ncbi:hypothetical protein K432DRAFT_307764 [Lepidopterella palustris CBS 459.81]|uniref:CorA-like transporter domain-containing protein n=1 Tax=Lepidopterella palustris CBS 459.81 TaxID=1314670 RepID=A0A8E2JBE2_9PEZI|nr:hypothetical protein K432DRAFT_307764 [Lepidopterella palustris CBS 459.81]
MVERKITPACFHRWEEYPGNLPLSLLYINPNRCSERLSQDSERLFVPEKDDIPFTLSSFIRQRFSWGRLLISEDTVRKLFTSLTVHPDFLEVVHLFGEKSEPVEESFSVYFCHPLSQYQPSYPEHSFSNEGYVIGYNIKYVAEHGRPFLKDPYSVRETGVFQLCANGSNTTQRCNWIFVHPSEALEERLGEIFKNAKETSCALQFQIHALALLSVSENWRTYTNYLEESFRLLLERGFYTKVIRPTAEGDIEADFSDIRMLQLLTDKLRRLCHILQLNIDLGVQLKCISLLMAHPQIQNILDIRTAESSSRINSAVHDITEQGIQENKLIKMLTHQAAKDTRATKLITLLSAIFLPAIFVAVGIFWWHMNCPS